MTTGTSPGPTRVPCPRCPQSLWAMELCAACCRRQLQCLSPPDPIGARSQLLFPQRSARPGCGSRVGAELTGLRELPEAHGHQKSSRLLLLLEPQPWAARSGF